MSSLVESGIYQKIRQDVASSYAKGDYHKVFWVREQLRPNKPFTIDHAIPAFIVLGFGLVSSTLTFALELLRHLCRKKRTSKASGSTLMAHSKVDKDDLRFGKRNIEDAESEPY